MSRNISSPTIREERHFEVSCPAFISVVLLPSFLVLETLDGGLSPVAITLKGCFLSCSELCLYSAFSYGREPAYQFTVAS